ncbi:leucine--tRNA ligase [Desulfurococcaceae archaeon AG1]|nr:leucine--tRNA ligase [Desulfurococcaceae archaeon AG1]
MVSISTLTPGGYGSKAPSCPEDDSPIDGSPMPLGSTAAHDPTGVRDPCASEVEVPGCERASKNINKHPGTNGALFSGTTDPIEWLKSISSKWQSVWEAEGVYRVERVEARDRRKFFVTAAFPYPNSPIHIGNARSYVLADIIARHRRTRGENVLYPMGFHYTGTPILTMAESIEAGDTELIDLFVNIYNVPREIALKLSKPIDLAQYFHRISRDSMKILGLGIDWRREFTTIDPYFSSFIRWQFELLREKGFVTRGTYPVGWCPKHGMPVGGHDTKDDKDPEIGEFTLIFFKDENGRVLPAATLRPETVFGVTNIWINPDADYVEAEVEGSTWIISKRSYEKLLYQKRGVKYIRSISPEELLLKTAINPITGEKIPILPARFVDPETGTGVVMSVPAHSPDDYQAYTEILKNAEGIKPNEPRVVIRVPGIKGIPAKHFVEKHRVKDQLDREALEKATKELYSLEYNLGSMERDLSRLVKSDRHDQGFLVGFIKGWVEGKRIPEARENISTFIKLSGVGDSLYEITNKPVYCRCGTEIVVKMLENQWFIDYSNQGWKTEGLELLRSMYIQPPEMREYMANLIGNLREKPCARTRGLGTPLPWDTEWIIESLSDSTIYMAFYTISHKLREIVKDPSMLGKSFWDYVMLGKGDPGSIARNLGIKREDLEDLRKDFLYWYPLDLRVAGKDLANNHLLFFIMNHVAVFPRDLWPRAMLIHGWVLREGRKMSKSLRNILPVSRAVDLYGSDSVRIALSTLSEEGQDLDFRHEAAVSIAENIRRIYELLEKLVKMPVREDPSELDKVYASRIVRSILRADDALEKLRVREAGIGIIYDVANTIAEYIRRSDSVWKEILGIVRAWVIMLSIYAPHAAEEIWHSVLGEKSLVVRESFDREDLRRYIDRDLELKHIYLRSLSEDLTEIISILRKKPSRVVIYTAPQSEIEILRKSLEAQRKGEGIRPVMEAYLGKLGLGSRDEEALRIKRIFDHASSLSEELASMILEGAVIDEIVVIRSSLETLREATGASVIEVYGSWDPSAPDYRGKKKEAMPLRPGIYVE